MNPSYLSLFKTALRRAIEWPRTKKHAYASLGLVPPRGKYHEFFTIVNRHDG